jgi:hypothetical protein
MSKCFPMQSLFKHIFLIVGVQINWKMLRDAVLSMRFSVLHHSICRL